MLSYQKTQRLRLRLRIDLVERATTMPEFAAAVYDAIIGSEMFGDYDTVRKGLGLVQATLC